MRRGKIGVLKKGESLIKTIYKNNDQKRGKSENQEEKGGTGSQLTAETI